MEIGGIIPTEEEKLAEYDKLVAKTKNSKIPEIPIAQNISKMNMNMASGGIADNPVFGSYMAKNAPNWYKKYTWVNLGSFVLLLIILTVLYALNSLSSNLYVELVAAFGIIVLIIFIAMYVLGSKRKSR